MGQRITDKLVKTLEPPARGNTIIYDTETRGFGVRVTAAGSVSFVLNYRAKDTGRERRLTIGAYPTWSVIAARKEAEHLKRLRDQGYDPMGEIHADRAAPTIKELADRYIEDHLPNKRPGTQYEDRWMIEKIVVPKFGKRKVTEIRHRDILDLHRALRDKPTRANRTVSLLSRLFNFAIRADLRQDNPAKGVERYPEQHRERYLTQVELVRLSEALAEHPNQQAANVVRLLLLTGARRSEVLNMAWDQLDLETGVWTKPAASTKQKKMHRIPLNAPARELLAEIKAQGQSDEFVFPGRMPGQPFEAIHREWDPIRQRAKIPDVRLHDLRHSYASILASAGLSLPVIGALLGHSQPGTTAR